MTTADAVGRANLMSATASADDEANMPWALLHVAGWLGTAAILAAR